MSKFEAEFGPLLSRINPIERATTGFGKWAYLLGLDAGNCYDEISNLRKRHKITGDFARSIWVARDEIKDTDKGTGLLNKNYFDRNLQQRVEEFHRLSPEEKYPIAVSLADINGMKDLNTRFGHDLTDDIIRLEANLMASNYRLYEVFRRSGDEFLAMQPHGDFEAAMNSALRTQVTIKENTPQLIRYLSRQLNQEVADLDLSISFGVTDLDYYGNDTAEDITTRADWAMYAAKRLVHEDPNIEAIGLSKAAGQDAVTMVFTYMKKDCRQEMIPELQQEIRNFINRHRRSWLLNQIGSVKKESIEDLARKYEEENRDSLFRLYDRINKQPNPPRSEYH